MGLNLQTLQLSTICELHNGEIEVACNQAIERMIRDCMDRPGVPKDRILDFKMKFKPVPDPQGNLLGIDVSFEFVEKGPVRASDRSYAMEVRMGPGNRPQLVFNKFDADNPNQMTIDEVFEPGEEEESEE